jgi:hypothetical protein
MKIIPTEHALWRKNKDGDWEEVVNQQYTQQQAKRMHELLVKCKGVMLRTYDATEWPANGETDCDITAGEIDQLLAKLTKT